MVRLFEKGERVRARTSVAVSAGTLGRIYLRLLSAADMYFVQFDGYDRLALMHMAELEPVAEAEQNYS